MQLASLDAPSRANQADMAPASSSPPFSTPPGMGRLVIKLAFNDQEQWMQFAERAGFQVQTLARQIGLSRRQVERYIKRHFGLTPQQWIRQLRMTRALQLISELHSVKEVAYALGFSQVSSFCHQFKAHHGMTCSEYAAVIVDRGKSDFITHPCVTQLKFRFKAAPAA